MSRSGRRSELKQRTNARDELIGDEQKVSFQDRELGSETNIHMSRFRSARRAIEAFLERQAIPT
jgi:hypothetical protein